MGPPELRVTKLKQKRIAIAASEYLSTMTVPADDVTFDVIAIYWPKGRQPQISHLQSASNIAAES